MTDMNVTTENPAPSPKKRRKQTRRRAAPRAAAATEPQDDELAGLTANDCCDACSVNMAASLTAQKRLNEIEMMYPRRPAPLVTDPRTGWRLPAATVMETDEQYIARNPPIAEEFVKLGKAVLGSCKISGQPGCAHPHKGGLPRAAQSDPQAVARYLRAKRLLEHQKIEHR